MKLQELTIEGFSFEPKDHKYYLDNEEIPSVSQILNPLKDDYSRVPVSILERAQNFGNAVHQMISLHLQGILDEDNLDKNLKPVLDGFKEWQDKYKIIKNPISEKSLCHLKLKYAGTIDIIEIDNLHIIDLKTRKLKPKYDLIQLTAYRELVMQYMLLDWKIGILALDKTGSYKWQVFEPSKGYKVFRALLDIYKGNQVIEQYLKTKR